MSSGSSKEAMDIAVASNNVESIEERQARVKLWDKVKAHTRHTIEQVMSLITGLIDRHDREEMAEILHFSCEYTAALLKDEPVDEKAVWQAYDNSCKLLDIVPLIPAQWEKYLDPKFWDLPPLEEVPPVPPLGRKDFERLKQMPKKHMLHLPHLAAFEPKYKISA